MNSRISGVKTRQQIANEYGICRKTFNKLLHQKKIQIEKGLIYPKDQLRIYDELGEPAIRVKEV